VWLNTYLHKSRKIKMNKATPILFSVFIAWCMIKHRSNGILVFQLSEYEILKIWLQLSSKCFISISYLHIHRLNYVSVLNTFLKIPTNCTRLFLIRVSITSLLHVSAYYIHQLYGLFIEFIAQPTYTQHNKVRMRLCVSNKRFSLKILYITHRNM
jgi:hypothetical protein